MIRTSFSITTNTNEFGISSLKMLVSPAGSRKNRPDGEQQREHDRAGPGGAADLLAARPLVVGQLRVGRDAERPEADLHRLEERHHAPDHRQPQRPVALGRWTPAARRDLDLALAPSWGRARPPRAARAAACARPPPRWTRRASSRPRARPGRRSAGRAGPPSWARSALRRGRRRWRALARRRCGVVVGGAHLPHRIGAYAAGRELRWLLRLAGQAAARTLSDSTLPPMPSGVGLGLQRGRAGRAVHHGAARLSGLYVADHGGVDHPTVHRQAHRHPRGAGAARCCSRAPRSGRCRASPPPGCRGCSPPAGWAAGAGGRWTRSGSRCAAACRSLEYHR